MKKIMLSLLAIAATMNVMAAINIDAKAKITISASGAESSLILIQSSDLNEGWNNGYCGEIYDLSEFPLALYVQYGGKNYASFGTKDLTSNDIVLAAKDNGASEYTITVSNATNTTPLKLMFGAKEIPFEDGTYTLTAAELAAATKVASAAVKGICNNYDKLQITGYAGAQLEVLNYADKASVFTETVAGDNVEIDLETKGLTANTQYFVKLTPAGETAKEYVIKYKPAVTPANP